VEILDEIEGYRVIKAQTAAIKQNECLAIPFRRIPDEV